MPISWPDGLPQNQFIGLKRKRQNAKVRTPNDAGPAKQRRRFTNAVLNITVPIVLKGSQMAIWDGFHDETLAEGSLSFTWEDPVYDEEVQFRVIEPPEFELVSGNSDPEERVWQGELALEILP